MQQEQAQQHRKFVEIVVLQELQNETIRTMTPNTFSMFPCTGLDPLTWGETIMDEVLRKHIIDILGLGIVEVLCEGLSNAVRVIHISSLYNTTHWRPTGECVTDELAKEMGLSDFTSRNVAWVMKEGGSWKLLACFISTIDQATADKLRAQLIFAKTNRLLSLGKRGKGKIAAGSSLLHVGGYGSPRNNVTLPGR